MYRTVLWLGQTDRPNASGDGTRAEKSWTSLDVDDGGLQSGPIEGVTGACQPLTGQKKAGNWL